MHTAHLHKGDAMYVPAGSRRAERPQVGVAPACDVYRQVQDLQKVDASQLLDTHSTYFKKVAAGL
jgi:hypothetical protein